MKVYVESHGCSMNYGEGQLIKGRLSNAGFGTSVSPEEADVIILNTCGVISHTENSMHRRIQQFASTGKRVIVTGCLATPETASSLSSSSEIAIMPPGDMNALDAFLGLNLQRDMDCWNQVEENTLIVPISSGCLSACTYCFSRIARGRVKSVRPQRIVEMIRLNTSGEEIREVLISSMDTIAYGRDIGTTLPDLLRSICELDTDFKLRVGMMNPSLLPPLLDDLLEVFEDGRIFKFFHLPVQSGSDAVLKRMRRGYTVDQYISLVREVRNAFPDMTFSTDVITGFPGESEEDFEETLALLENVKPDIVNVTRFSSRPGTRAASMPEQIAGWISKERSRKVSALRFRISAEKNAAYVGNTYRALTTENGKDNSTLARIDNYRQVVLDSRYPLGRYVTCRITGSTPIHLTGKVQL
ncbi:MAG: tRNA (N(6)-L-threonylcarbamoyladenosine(37)-C(2))-methylthiotransferase [Methanomassiliicoccales archaeon]